MKNSGAIAPQSSKSLSDDGCFPFSFVFIDVVIILLSFLDSELAYDTKHFIENRVSQLHVVVNQHVVSVSIE